MVGKDCMCKGRKKERERVRGIREEPQEPISVFSVRVDSADL